MVRLTRIYTRTGDAGETHLGDMTRAPKDGARITAVGDVDELNSAIGLARASGAGRADPWLGIIQNDLFDLGADLAVPGAPGDESGEKPPLRIDEAKVAQLESWCDEINAGLPDLTSFVLPGGTSAGAGLHLARAVCRRAERAAVALSRAEAVNPQALAYLNRLSDLLFILAREANGPEGEILWIPGGRD